MRIINVFKTHFDIGYTDLSRNVIANYGGKMLSDILDTCEATADMPAGRRFVWTMAAWPLLRSLETCTKENRVRAERMIENGQIVIHALPFTLHTESLSVGDLPHLFDASREFCERYGKPFPRTAKMTDVPGHTLALIRPLYENGVRFLHLGCNPATTPPRVPILFWWEDPEGRRILVFYNNTYGSKLAPPRNWRFPVWLSLQQTNDNCGPQKPEMLDAIVSETKRLMPDAETVFGSMEDFYNEIIRCDLSGLPIIRQDLGDTWIQGVGTYPREVSALRRAREIAAKADLSESDAKAFYDQSLLFSEHTWGMNVDRHLLNRSYQKNAFIAERSRPDYRLMEESWDEQRERAMKCKSIAAKYGEIYPALPDAVTENDRLKIDFSDGILTIRHKTSGTVLTPRYSYEIIGTERMNHFLRRYLTRFVPWSVDDLGRVDYPEIPDRKYNTKRFRVIPCEGNGYITVGANCAKESMIDSGNVERVMISAGIVEGKVLLRLTLSDKVATPLIEAGNLLIATNLPGNSYRIKKLDCELDPAHDICYNANQRLYSVSDLAQIDTVKINPLDSPLVSFGKSTIDVFCGGAYRKPSKPDFCFHIFNTAWGTNFPQWIEWKGDATFEYLIDFTDGEAID